jgi:putative DNA primase/helicase
MDALRSLCLIPDLNLPRYLGEDPGFPRPEGLIALKNGLLDVDGYLRGREDCLRPHTPLWLSTNVLSYPFDPGATCDRWRWFIDDILCGDGEAVEFLQRWLGLNLVPDLSHQAIVIVPGSGSNGKGVFADTAIALLGMQNVATPTFSSLAERFGRACLLGKLAAFLPDAHLGRDTDSIRVLELLKSVSGGDPVDIEEKNKPMMTGVRLRTRFTIMVNEMPKLPDASRGIGRRVRIVPFHQSYEGREDRTLRGKLGRELPGILLWALEGLRKLRRDGRLDQPAVGKTMSEEFLADCSPIHTFLGDYCEVGPDCCEEKDRFRRALNSWLVENGHNSLSGSSWVRPNTMRTRSSSSFSDRGGVLISVGCSMGIRVPSSASRSASASHRMLGSIPSRSHRFR